MSCKTVLWAMNEKCPFGCKYCYLRFDKEHIPIVENRRKALYKSILNFLIRDEIKNIFLAGAEPLLDDQIINTIKFLKKKNKTVILCTNAITDDFSKLTSILKSKVDAISISLDSFDNSYNDWVRVKGSWNKVVQAIEFLRGEILKHNYKTKIGIYTVISRKNLKNLFDMYKFCSYELKVDYFIYQPITLPINHVFYSQLALRPSDINVLKDEVSKISNLKTHTYSPSLFYNTKMFEGLNTNLKIKKCFINNNFIFLMPDGSYSNCPCAIPNRNVRNLNIDNNIDFQQVIGCESFSEECANIVQLLNFQEILND